MQSSDECLGSQGKHSTSIESVQRRYRGKQSYPIPVWNGILEHMKQIDTAIWLYLWCLDKVTKEKDGIGYVLGGAPVKISTISKELERCPRALGHDFQKLKTRYLRLRRTPYGYVIMVLNSKKFDIWKHSRKDSKVRGDQHDHAAEIGTLMAILPTILCRSKEDSAVDSARKKAERQTLPSEAIVCLPSEEGIFNSKERAVAAEVAECGSLREFDEDGTLTPRVEAAAQSLGYTLPDERLVGIDFALAMLSVVEKYPRGSIGGNDKTPADLAGEIIGRCNRSVASYPPDFLAYLRRLRREERKAQIVNSPEREGYPFVGPRSQGHERETKSCDQRTVLIEPSYFDLFWDSYPRKVGKVDAKKAWSRIPGVERHAMEIISAVEKYKKTTRWSDWEFVPNPATFLNQRRWEDEIRPGAFVNKRELAQRAAIETARRVVEAGRSGDDFGMFRALLSKP